MMKALPKLCLATLFSALPAITLASNNKIVGDHDDVGFLDLKCEKSEAANVLTVRAEPVFAAEPHKDRRWLRAQVMNTETGERTTVDFVRNNNSFSFVLKANPKQAQVYLRFLINNNEDPAVYDAFPRESPENTDSFLHVALSKICM